MTEEQKREFEEARNWTSPSTPPGMGRYRVNLFCQARGPAAVFRTIPTQIPTFDGPAPRSWPNWPRRSAA